MLIYLLCCWILVYLTCLVLFAFVVGKQPSRRFSLEISSKKGEAVGNVKRLHFVGNYAFVTWPHPTLAHYSAFIALSLFEFDNSKSQEIMVNHIRDTHFLRQVHNSSISPYTKNASTYLAPASRQPFVTLLKYERPLLVEWQKTMAMNMTIITDDGK